MTKGGQAREDIVHLPKASWTNKRICMGKSCWLASLALQQLFPIQILLTFPTFKLLPNIMFQCYRPQTWQFYLVFPALSISGIREVPGITFKGG